MSNLAAEGAGAVLLQRHAASRPDPHRPGHAGRRRSHHPALRRDPHGRLRVPHAGPRCGSGRPSRGRRRPRRRPGRSAMDADLASLLFAIMSGLPDACDRFDLTGPRMALARYEGLGRADLRAILALRRRGDARRAGSRGRDDGPHPATRRATSRARPASCSTQATPSRSLVARGGALNGLTSCSGSLGAHPDSDVPAIAGRFADRIRFFRPRNVRREVDGSFEAAAHLDGDSDMVALIRVALEAEARGGRHPVPPRPRPWAARRRGPRPVDDVQPPAHPRLGGMGTSCRLSAPKRVKT